MAFEHLRIDNEGAVAWVTLNAIERAPALRQARGERIDDTRLPCQNSVPPA